jgi:hypothetical protein
VTGYDKPLYMLALDHRTSFQTKLFGIDGTPTPYERGRIREAKRIILDGLLAAAETVPPGTVGALVDEEHGAAAAREAKRRGLPVAMAAEKSSMPEFDFEYGADFARHIEEFEPDFVKVLARYNPEGDRELTAGRRSGWRGCRTTSLRARPSTSSSLSCRRSLTSSPRSSQTPGGSPPSSDPSWRQRRSPSSRRPASNLTSGRSKDWRAPRIAISSRTPPAPGDVTMSPASS